MYTSDERTFTVQTVPSWKLVKPIRTEATERTRTTNMAAISDNGGQGKGIAEGLTQGGIPAHLTPTIIATSTLISRTDPRNSPLPFPLYAFPFYPYVWDVSFTIVIFFLPYIYVFCMHLNKEKKHYLARKR